MRHILATILFLTAVGVIESKKILLLPFMTPSHLLQLGSIGDGLLKKGHEVHMLVHSGQKVPSNILKWGVKIIRYKSRDEEFMMDTADFQTGMVNSAAAGGSVTTRIFKLLSTLAIECESLVINPDLMSRLRQEKFDFAVVDGSPISKCFYVITHRLGIEHASVTPIMPFDEMVSLQVPYLNPVQIDTSFSMVSTFRQRLLATVSLMLMPKAAAWFMDEAKLRDACETPFESLNALMRKTHLWLVDLDSLVDVPKHLAPNMVIVGGISSSPPLPLEKEFKTFADSATEGLVVITFGGTIGFLPEEYVNRIVKAVEKVKYKVVFRQKTKPTVKVPKNLMIVDWMPQNDLLAHPNTKVFVTHCGSNGQHEAVNHGVLMLGLPVHGDQVYNAARFTAKGYGRYLPVATVTPDELAAAIEDVATNPQYRANIKKASKVFKSRPMAPRERAAFWIEHVMEHGSDHLQAYTNQLAWYQVLMLDEI